MFSLKIINSARFLKMPVDTQVLYFHLGLHADDDGVVEAYPIVKTLGSNEDNLRVLAAKGLVRVLNEDLVTFITDWNEHNLIRADRKVDSLYKELLLQLVPEAELVEPKNRADRPSKMGRPRDVNGTAQVRLGKDRIGKGTTLPPAEADASLIVKILDAFEPVNPSFRKWYAVTTQRKACSRMIETHGVEQVLAVIALLPKTNGKPYFPTITTPVQLEDKWASLEAALRRMKEEAGGRKQLFV